MIITDRQGDIFQYEVNPFSDGPKIRPESQRLQRTLFHEKQTIIENCLFGVDINPNSVKICRLRLWIELLKNAYYKPPPDPLLYRNVEEIETLPNIDINIKTGNSLISRFPLDANLSKFGQREKNIIEQYRKSVSEYKNEKSGRKKKEIEEIILNLKTDIRTEIGKTDPKLVKMMNIKGELDNLENQGGLFEQTKKEQKDQTSKKKKLTAELAKIQKEVDDIKSNAIYRNAFEWRFEFPEVLSSEGEYVGFDVVIGNPPYIDIKGLDPNFSKYLFSKFTTTENRINLYSIFIELGYNILSAKGIFYFINPNSILMNSSYSKIRTLLFDNLNEIIKLPDNVFHESNVIVETIILSFRKKFKSDNINIIKFKHSEKIINIDKNLKELQHKEIWKKIYEDVKFNIYLDDNIQSVIKKSFYNTQPLSELADFSLGITPYDKYRGHTKDIIENRKFHSKEKLNEEYKPLISGENITKYFINDTISEYINYGAWLGAQREERFFQNPRVIVRQIVSGKPPRIYVGYTDKDLYFTQIGFGIVPYKDITPKYLAAILNSTLLNFIHKFLFLDIEKELFQKVLIENCKKFPIKKISLLEQQPFINFVNEILESKKQGKDATALEEEIDRMVYELYGLTEEEVRVVEGKS